MKYTQALQDWEQTFDNYIELDSDDFYVEAGCFVEFYDENSEDFTDLENELYWKVDGLIDVAGEYFDEIAKEEEAEERRDHQAYLTSQGNH
jgi:hypothetical protein